MAITNHERVARGLEVLKQGLGSFAEREWKNAFKDQARAEVARFLGEDRLLADKPIGQWDAAALLKLMWEARHDVFRNALVQSWPEIIRLAQEKDSPPAFVDGDLFDSP